MSSPLSTEHHQVLDHREEAQVVVPAEDQDSRSTETAAKQAHDTALPSQTSAAKFAFDETLFGSTPVVGDTVEDTVGDTAIDDDDHDDDIPYPDVEEEGSHLPPPDFKPFFTLIEDYASGEHHHPTVHYIFTDDDQDMLTAAALETISDEQQVPEDERFVIVDVSLDGREVANVSSLSPDWQTLKTKVTQAPSWGDESKTGEKGLMLRISGQEAETWSDRRRKGDVDGLLKAFDELADTLEGVLGSPAANTDTQIAQ